MAEAYEYLIGICQRKYKVIIHLLSITDNGNQKQFSNKYAKRRENNGSRSYYPDSSPRNPIAPKNRYGVDKRPRPRGGGFPREDVTTFIYCINSNSQHFFV